MANVNRVNGFLPVGHIDGSPWNGQTRMFYKAAGTTVTDDLMPGDLVIMSGSGDAAGVPGISRATAGAGNAICGAIVSIVPLVTNLNRRWLDGADAGYVNVACDPDTVFECQANAAITYTECGRNAPMVQTSAGSRTTGSSGMECGTNSATTNDQLKILGFVQKADNTINSLYNRILVLINCHQFKGSETGNAAV